MTLTLTHTAAEGTLLHGTDRGDGTADVLRAVPSRWKWSRNLGAWYIAQSRDRAPQHDGIRATVEELEDAGFVVEQSVDATPRATADVEADRVERAGDRAEALHAKAARKLAESDAHYEADRAIAERIPMGQPILVGHHSEAGHRRDIKRMHAHMDAFCELRAESAETERRARAADHTAAGRRESRVTVTNRIGKLAVEVARDLRSLHGYWSRWGQVQTWDEATNRPRAFPVDADSDYGQTLIERITQNTDARRYWADVLNAMPAPAVDFAEVRKGDLVRFRGRWETVVRVSAKSVSVETGYSWTDRVPKVEITAHRSISV